MKSVRHILLGLAVSTASSGWAQEAAPRSEATAESEVGNCSFNGWRPGAAFSKERIKGLKKVKPRVADISPSQSWEAGSRSQLYRQYVVMGPGVFRAIVREYPGDQSQKVFSALIEKYGQPTVSPLAPQVKSNFHPFGGNVKQTSKALFRDHECGYDIEYLSQTSMTITAFGGGSSEGVAIVISLSTTDDSGQSTLLE